MTRNILGTLALIGLFAVMAWSGREPESEPMEVTTTKSQLERGCEVYERVWRRPCPSTPQPERHYYPPRGEYLDI